MINLHVAHVMLTAKLVKIQQHTVCHVLMNTISLVTNAFHVVEVAQNVKIQQIV